MIQKRCFFLTLCELCACRMMCASHKKICPRWRLRKVGSPDNLCQILTEAACVICTKLRAPLRTLNLRLPALIESRATDSIASPEETRKRLSFCQHCTYNHHHHHHHHPTVGVAPAGDPGSRSHTRGHTHGYVTDHKLCLHSEPHMHFKWCENNNLSGEITWRLNSSARAVCHLQFSSASPSLELTTRSEHHFTHALRREHKCLRCSDNK